MIFGELWGERLELKGDPETTAYGALVGIVGSSLADLPDGEVITFACPGVPLVSIVRRDRIVHLSVGDDRFTPRYTVLVAFDDEKARAWAIQYRDHAITVNGSRGALGESLAHETASIRRLQGFFVALLRALRAEGCAPSVLVPVS